MVNLFQTQPKVVALVALGASSYDYLGHVLGHNCDTEFDEVWSLNMGVGVFRHDMLWVMDDLRRLNKEFPAYGKILMKHDKPIVTSVVYPEFPTSVAYPLDEVVQAIGDDYFRNTVCYAMGYAMASGVKELYLYGCDFFYPNLADREEGSMNAAYLLGMSRHFGMKFRLPQSTTLLGASTTKEDKEGKLHRVLYGYEIQPWEIKDGSAKTRPGTSALLRASEGDDAVPTGQNQPGGQDQGRETKSAAVHPAREDMDRSRRRSKRAARVVLERSAQNGKRSAERVRTQVAIGPDGEARYLCPSCQGPAHQTYEEFAHCKRTQSDPASKAVDV